MLHRYCLRTFVFLLAGCGIGKETTNNQWRVERQVDAGGRVHHEYFDEKRRTDWGKLYLSRVHRQYDSTGKLVSEQRDDFPQPGQSQFSEIAYLPNTVVQNIYRWKTFDTGTIATQLPLSFVQQSIIVGRPGFAQHIIIDKISLNPQWFTGQYREYSTKLDSISGRELRQSNIYNFRVATEKVSFDGQKRLVLRDVEKLEQIK